jgi:quercetin dioxygenase-like cupin family protein
MRQHQGGSTMKIIQHKRLTIAAGASLAVIAGGTALATAPSGETPAPLARGALIAPANVNVKVAGGRVKIKTQGALDAFMLNITLAPGGTGGWHKHAGALIQVVKQGTLTIFDANCKRHDITAGHAFISAGNTRDKDENRGSTPASFYVTFLLPKSVGSPRIDTLAPAGCTA